jgi:hypothetical protein
MLNGNSFVASYLDTFQLNVRYLNRRSPNVIRKTELDRVFSVTRATGEEILLYKPDSLSGEILSAQDMRYFIYGQQDARKHYKAYWTYAVGFASGALLPSLGIWGLPDFLPPFAFAFLVNIPKITIKQKMVSNPQYMNEDAYLAGFQRIAEKKRMFNVLKGGAVGLALGFGLYSLVYVGK